MSKVRIYCPYNIAIYCTSHRGLPITQLPECCSKCGWNPEVVRRRREEVRQKYAGYQAQTATAEVH